MKLFKTLFILIGGVLSLCGCSNLDLLDFLTPSDGYIAHTDIAYGDQARQKLDVYVPEHPLATHPVVVFFYGGSWQWGRKEDYRFVGQAFASHGIVTIVADYRLYPEVYFPAFMNDCAAAFVWAHTHAGDYGGDADNMFVMGHSAGAYNAIMLTANETYLKQAGGQTGWIRGSIGLAGPYDFLPMTDPKIIALFSKADPVATQPITYVRAGLPPMLLLTGDADQDVMARNSIAMAERLRQSGDQVEQKTYPGIDHIDIVLSLASGFRDRAPAFADSMDFISAYGKKSSTP